MPRQPDEVLDELLILRSQGGDSSALEDLARRWHPRLLRHAIRYVSRPDAAGDVVQEAWLGIIRGLRRLRDPARFRPWAYRIVANKSRDWIRREERRRRLSGGVLPDPVAVDAGEKPEPDFDARSASDLRVGHALRSVDESKKAMLALHYVDGLSVGEIAEILSIPEGTVKSRLFHARQAFRDALEEVPHEAI